MYDVFYENDEIRIIQVTYQPGQSDAPHSHPEYIAYVLESGTLRVHSSGNDTEERSVERGQILVQKPVEQHWAENIGDSVVRAVFLEIKQAPADEEPIYEITHITGDLYRYRHSGEYSIFLVTSEGVVLVDPLAEVDKRAPAWLKGQLATRFGVPVRYVIYSHHHMDRAAGGDDRVYSESLSLELGGQRVELMHPGPNHADDMTVVYFPEERTVFLAGILRAFTGLPSGYFSGRPMSDWINSFNAIEGWDFDIFVPGGGPMGNKADVTLTRMAWEDLRSAVAEGIEEGLSIEELQRSIRLDNYQHYPGYEEKLPASIAEAYRAIMTHER
jgi:glyoxylase-like metal-dependent hydrolase (beta-lactamase superfamily II)/quercetin dioxygenase-like cupin family protein